MADLPKTRWPIEGFGPGAYHCKCLSCRELFLGDKRANSCSVCALKYLARINTQLVEALRPLVQVANAYDNNDLDGDARKYWGKNAEHKNPRSPEETELYGGRGGKILLTLADCLKAREVVKACGYNTEQK